MLGGLRTEKVGNEVKVYDGDHLRFQLFPLPEKTARQWGSVAGLLIRAGGEWPLDRDGTRLWSITGFGPNFSGYVPAGPIGEYGWLLDLVQEAGLVLSEPATHQETVP